MKKIFFQTSFLAVLGLILTFIRCSNDKTKSSDNVVKTNTLTSKDVVKEGEHLVMIMGCNDCHSPKQMGPNGLEIIPGKMLSGYPSDRPIVKFDSKLIKKGFPMFYPDLTASAGPWGISFAGNLTPDDTGIGNWTEEQFKKALTQGKYKGIDGSRTLLPPMPWVNYQTLTNDEIHSIFTYLQSIKPVKNIVPNPINLDKM